MMPTAALMCSVSNTSCKLFASSWEARWCQATGNVPHWRNVGAGRLMGGDCLNLGGSGVLSSKEWCHIAALWALYFKHRLVGGSFKLRG